MSQVPRKKTNPDLQVLTSAFNTGETQAERNGLKNHRDGVEKQKQELRKIQKSINEGSLFSMTLSEESGIAFKITHKATKVRKEYRVTYYSGEKVGSSVHAPTGNTGMKDYDLTQTEGRQAFLEQLGIDMKICVEAHKRVLGPRLSATK